jgi:hypothetical protein
LMEEAHGTNAGEKVNKNLKVMEFLFIERTRYKIKNKQMPYRRIIRGDCGHRGCGVD